MHVSNLVPKVILRAQASPFCSDSLPWILVNSLYCFESFFVLPEFQAANNLTKMTVKTLASDFNSEVEPLFSVCVFSNEEMTAANVVNASKVALINFYAGHVVVTSNSVWVFIGVALDNASPTAPKLSIFKDVTFFHQTFFWLLKNFECHFQIGLIILIWLGKFKIEIIRGNSKYITLVCDWFHYHRFFCYT